MKLLEMEMHNFMPYRGNHKVAFPADPSRNVMVVFGPNMRGKTSLLNAIRWCFYGEALDRQLNAIALPKIVNKEAAGEGDWEVSVFTTFEANGHNYDLRRVAKLRDLVDAPRRDDDFEPTLSMRRDGKVLQGDAIEHEINQIMPSQIARFFLFDAELLEQYEALLSDDSDQGQAIKEAIEQVLGVPALIKGRDEIRTLLKKAQAVQAKENKHVEGMASQAEQYARLQVEIDSLSADVTALKGKEVQLRTEIAALDEVLASTEAAQKAQAQLDGLLAEHKRVTERVTALKEEQLTVIEGAWKDLLQPRLQQRLNELIKERDGNQASIQERGSLVARIDLLKRLLSQSRCSVCGQDVVKARRDEFGAQLGKLEGELTAVSADMAKLGEVSAEISRISRIRGVGALGALQRIDTEMSRAAVDHTRLEGEIASLKRQVAGHDTAEIARQRNRRDHFMQNLGRLQDEMKRSEKQKDEKVGKQNQLSRLMSKAPTARTQRSAREVELYGTLEKVFAGGVDTLRDRLREAVAARATEAFLKLTTEKTYRGLTINDSYGLTIIDQQGRPVSVRSAGAEQIVALSLIDGLNRTARKSGPIVMDTPLGRLDPKHRANVLAYVPTMADQVVLLAHEGEINRDEDLQPLASRIGAIYDIERISATESQLVREKGGKS
jgi:DNA sulfur modification protein DndD